MPPARRLDPPGHYDAARREIWADAVQRLADQGGVFRADPNLIDAYVEAVATHRQAAQLRAQTAVMITRGDRAIENPALTIQRRAAADIAKTARALGLHRTPMQSALAESPLRGDGRRWCDHHHRDECKHDNKRGGPCHSDKLIAGTGSCRMHVGMSAEAARAKGAEVLARMYGTPADVTPGEALLEEVRYSAGHVRELRAMVADLAAAGGPDGQPGCQLWFGTSIVRDRGDGTVETEARAGPHVILRAYDAERDHLVRAASAAHTAGALEAQADQARLLGVGLARLLDVIFAGLELTAYQRDQLIPAVVPAAIRAWQPDEAAGG